ncbi:MULTISPECIES: hypothetical protein [unclassified Streptomyces]|uniref:hypothetical protein n=1 Tax=unclassified Streptomyces TaxID=2593676 RepID=UPI002E2C164B|nr:MULTISPECIES: hypothetical protein [unclassified Streptomyces]
MTPLRREAHHDSLRDEADTAPEAGMDLLMCFQQVGAIPPHGRVLSAPTPILD